MTYSTIRKLFRGISLMLCIIMLMLNTQLFVFAVDVSPLADENIPDATPEATLPEDTPSENPFELGEGELPYAQLQELSPLDVALPETLTRAQAIEKGHVNRLWVQEKNMQSVLYQNQNGTKTAYVFDKPVKYVDADGNIKDKNTTIAATGIAGYAYAMTENSFSAYFGSTAANGVLIQYGDYTFSMKPETSLLVSTPTLGEDAKSVIYNGAFGARTALRYETQLSGVKEDIILMRNVGKYAFNFLLTTSGLTPAQQENGGWILVNGEQETVINFGSIVIKDSAGKTVYGALNIAPRAAGGYIMTVTVPQAFLQASDTVYPVYVDPSALVYEKSGSTEYIQDLGLYADNTSFMEGYLTPDRHFLNANTGKIVYRLLSFSDPQINSTFYDLTADQIESVSFRVRTYSAISGSTTISANPMSEEIYSDWSCYSNSSIFTQTNTLLENANTTDADFSANALINIDITDIVKGWAQYNEGISNADYENPQNGFVLSTNSTTTLELASVETSGSTHVSFIIDYSSFYGIYYMKSAVNQAILKASDSRTLFCNSSALSYQGSWIIEYQGDSKYLILPMYHPGYALYRNGTLQPLPTSITNGFYWYINANSSNGIVIKNYATNNVLCFDGTSLSMVAERGSGATNYSQTVWLFCQYNFGGREYRKITDSEELENINCLAYAMNRDSWSDDYYIEYACTSTKPLEEAQAEYAYAAHIRMIDWLNFHNYSYVFENDFSKNGENTSLNSNQYRVVLRTGVHRETISTGEIKTEYNFHFWYQTSDGRWAHKNGRNEPCLLSYGITPYSVNSGGWDLYETVDYYNCNTIYSYIITIP